MLEHEVAAARQRHAPVERAADGLLDTGCGKQRRVADVPTNKPAQRRQVGGNVALQALEGGIVIDHHSAYAAPAWPSTRQIPHHTNAHRQFFEDQRRRKRVRRRSVP